MTEAPPPPVHPVDRPERLTGTLPRPVQPVDRAEPLTGTLPRPVQPVDRPERLPEALPVWWVSAPQLSERDAAAFERADAAWLMDPARDELVIGLGSARDLSAAAAKGLSALARAQRALRIDARGDVQHGGALLLGASPFDPSRPATGAWGEGTVAARWVLPEITFVVRAGEAHCAVAGATSRADAEAQRDRALATRAAARPASSSRETPRLELDESPGSFQRRVRQAIHAMAQGEVQKVVLARCCHLHAAQVFDARRILAHLLALETDAVRYSLPLPAGRLIGATPERLLCVSGRQVSVDAIAGSMARGLKPESDLVAMRSLRESKKDQQEHAIVSRALVAALAPLLGPLDAPRAPRILSTAALHHLHTPLRASRNPQNPEHAALELAARVHPTPSVAGFEQAAALVWLRAHEPLARGAYAGPFGWVDFEGGGALSVALRCALLRGACATVFAGAGIVADSDPAAEWMETTLKMRTLLAALREPR